MRSSLVKARNIPTRVIVAIFIALTIMAAVAVGAITVFSLRQTSIRSSVKVSFKARDIMGSVALYAKKASSAANYTGTDADNWVGTFDFDGSTSTNDTAATLDKEIALDAANDTLYLHYVFTNTGDRAYTAVLDYVESEVFSENMKLAYSESGTVYGNSDMAIVVGKRSIKHYYVTISVENLAFNASFDGMFTWELNECDEDLTEAQEKSMVATTFTLINQQANTYSAKYNGQDISYPSISSAEVSAQSTDFKNFWYVPSVIDKGTVVRVEAGSKLPTATRVKIAEGVTEIITNTFSEDAGLLELEIPSTIKTISDSVCKNCSNLERVTIGSGVEAINSTAFANCTKLTSVSLPDSVKTLGTSAFYSCKNLASLRLSKNLTQIGDAAFTYCEKLPELILPNSVVTIGSSAFAYGYGIKTLEIPSSVKTIKGGAFYKCTGVELFKFNANLTTALDSANNTFAYMGNSASGVEVVFGDNASVPSNMFYNGQSSISKVIIGNGVKSIGEYAFYKCDVLKSVTIGENVTSIAQYTFYGCAGLKSVTIGENVTSIKNYAFYGCIGLNEVLIPNSVTTIGSFSFSYCDGLTEITIPQNVTSLSYGAFSSCSKLKTVNYNAINAYGCEYAFDKIVTMNIGSSVQIIPNGFCRGIGTLTSITIPSSVTVIGSDAFEDCDGLTEITIPQNITSLGYAAFANCYALKTVNYNATKATFGGSVFSNSPITTLVIGNDVQVIPGNFCSGISSIKEITIQSNVTEIGEFAFQRCSGLTEITIPQNVTTIGNGAFANCENLKIVNYNAANVQACYNVFSGSSNDAQGLTINIGSTVQRIPSNFLQKITQLKEITISSSVKTIGSYAFEGCSNLTNLNFENGIESMELAAFANCNGLTSVVLPNSLKTIGESGFYSCVNLESVTFGDNLTNLDKAAFAQCSKLNNVELPNGLTTVGESVFAECDSLTEIEIPSSLTKIEKGMFYGCSQLTSINIPNGVTTIKSSVFVGSRIYQIYLPSSVISIGDGAFNDGTECYYGGDSIVSVNLPKYTEINKTREQFNYDVANPAAKLASTYSSYTRNCLSLANAIDFAHISVYKIVVLRDNTMPISELTKDLWLTCENDVTLTMASPLKCMTYTLKLGEEGGKTITLKASNSIEKVVHVNLKANLYLYSGVIDGNNTSQCVTASGGIYIHGGGIQNGVHSVNGGGILTDGKIEMTGGFIRNCYLKSTKAAKLCGGAVSISQGTFIMTGGEIYNNYIDGVKSVLGASGSYDGSYGGAIYICDGATFEMYNGAKIRNNYIKTEGLGGNVCVSTDSYMYMYSGTIEGNSTVSALLGGGIANLGVLEIAAGTIKNLAATSGGGIASVGEFIMYGGTITNCKSLDSNGNQTAYGNAIANLGEFNLVGGNIAGDITNGYSPEINLIIIKVPEKIGIINVMSLQYVLDVDSESEALQIYKDVIGVDWCGFTGGYELTLCNVNASSYKVDPETYFTNNVANKTTPIVSYFGVTASTSHFNLTNTSLNLAVGSGSGYNTNYLYLKK